MPGPADPVDRKKTRVNRSRVSGSRTNTGTEVNDVTTTASATKELQDVAIYDAAGNQITSFGGGGGGGATHVDQAVFTPGTDDGTLAFGFVDDVSPSTVAEGSAGATRMTPNRALHHNIRRQDGTELGTVADPLRFDPTGATTQPISAASLPLPSGAATSANQTTEITSLQLIDDVIFVDNAAFTDNSSKLAAIGMYFDETAGTALTENDIAVPRIDSKRAQVMVIEDATTRGTRAVVTTPVADNVAVSSFAGLVVNSALWGFDGSTMDRLRGDSALGLDVDVTHVVPGTAAADLGKAEDAAHASGDTLVGVAAVRNDNLATARSGTDGDYTPLAVNAQGAQYKAFYRNTTTLTALNTTYNNTTTTATSAAIDAEHANEVMFMASWTESGAATDLTISIEVSDDNSTFFFWRKLSWVKYRYDDGTISAYGTLSEGNDAPIIPRYIRFRADAVGTDATNTFTLASARATIASTR